MDERELGIYPYIFSSSFVYFINFKRGIKMKDIGVIAIGIVIIIFLFLLLTFLGYF